MRAPPHPERCGWAGWTEEGGAEGWVGLEGLAGEE